MALLRARDLIMLLTLALVATADTLPSQSDTHYATIGPPSDSALESDSAIRFSKPKGCLAAIPPEHMHRVPVFLQASIQGHSDSPLKPQANLMAQDVANEYRRLLGAAGSTVPDADTNFVWYSVPTQLALVSHRNGDVTPRAISSGGDSAATLMLARAFDDVRARGGARVLYPGGFVDDSAVVYLTLRPEYVGDTSDPAQPDAPRTFAVFNLTEPEWVSAFPLPHQRLPKYPSESERHRIEGSVLMQFVVDTLGQVEVATVRELWPTGTPRLSGSQAEEHMAFVHAVTDWVGGVYFRPLRVGTCPRRQIVQLPVAFRVP